MAISTKAIKTRIKSVKNIGKITKAMEMVAAAKMKKAVENALGTRSYAELALELLMNISKEKNVRHPLLEQHKSDKILVLVIGSNKGLCGGFNANTSKITNKFYNEKKDKDKSVDFVTVGKKAETIVRKLGAKIIASFIDLPDNLRVEEIGGLSKIITDEYIKSDYSQVVMIYTNFVSSIKYDVEIKGLLPIAEKNIKQMIQALGKGGIEEEDMRLKSMSLYLFEPDSESILEEVLPRLTEIQIYQALLESAASEHSARMMAMRNANESAQEMIEDLSLSFNQARQAGITQEIAEIASGAAALS